MTGTKQDKSLLDRFEGSLSEEAAALRVSEGQKEAMYQDKVKGPKRKTWHHQ